MCMKVVFSSAYENEPDIHSRYAEDGAGLPSRFLSIDGTSKIPTSQTSSVDRHEVQHELRIGESTASLVVRPDATEDDEIGHFRRIHDIPDQLSELEQDYLIASCNYNHNKTHDIAYVTRKFHKAQRGSEWLLHRLGTAIADRRTFLAYRRDSSFISSTPSTTYGELDLVDDRTSSDLSGTNAQQR
jgi:hypothetical protein